VSIFHKEPRLDFHYSLVIWNVWKTNSGCKWKCKNSVTYRIFSSFVGHE